MVFSYSEDMQDDYTPADILDSVDYADQCAGVERYDMPDDAAFTGSYDEYNGCGSGNTTAVVAALIPQAGDYLVRIEVYATTDADLQALDHILDTFYIGKGGTTSAPVDVGSDIFDYVDVDGLEHDYAFVNEPYFSAVLPAEWTDINSRDWENEDGEYLGRITEVAPDIEAYRAGWDAAGMQAFLLTDVGPDFDVDASMDAVDFSDQCTYEERIDDVTHTIYGVTYSGKTDVYTRCDGSDAIYYTGVYLADSKDHAYIIDFVSESEADDEAFEVLLDSFFLGTAVQPALNSDEFAPVRDETGRISLQAPTSWTDTESNPFEIDDEAVGIEFTVAPDVAEYNDSWQAAGAYIAVWDDFGSADSDEVLDSIGFDDDCTYDSRYEYEADNFSGKYDLWYECGGAGGSNLASFALAFDSAPDALVVLYVVMPTDEDLSILDPILSSLRVAPADESSTPAAAPAVGNATPSVMILGDQLNVRSGPGTNYEIISNVDAGSSYLAVGQNGNCAWLLIEDSDGAQGWVSGAAQFTRLDGACADLASVAAPASAAAPAQGSATAPAQGSAAASGKPCVSFKNQVGIEVNITLTRQGDNWNTTFTVNKGQSGGQCVDPGKYTYTAATWDGRSLNGDMALEPGDSLQIDLNPG